MNFLGIAVMSIIAYIGINMYNHGSYTALKFAYAETPVSIIVKKATSGCKVHGEYLSPAANQSKEIEDCPSVSDYKPVCHFLRFPGK